MWKVPSIPLKSQQRFLMRYNLEYLINIVQTFYQENERVPTREDIEALHKQGKSPSLNTFSARGGLPWVIEKAALTSDRKGFVNYLPGQVREEFSEFIRSFRLQNYRGPTSAEYVAAVKNRECPSLQALKSHTGKTYKQALANFTSSPRLSKLANLPHNGGK